MTTDPAARITAALEAAHRRIDELEQSAQGELTCPRCSGQMIEFDHLGVTLDRCLDCEGLYFDAGELEEVLRAEYPEHDDEPEPEEPEEAPLVGDDEDTHVDMPAASKSGFFRTLFSRRREEKQQSS